MAYAVDRKLGAGYSAFQKYPTARRYQYLVLSKLQKFILHSLKCTFY